MNSKKPSELKDMIKTAEMHQQKFRELVAEANKEEKLLTQEIADKESQTPSSFGARMADVIADFGGSWTFILLFFFALMVWMTFNYYTLGNKGFDPYPFILLNLVLSCLAAIQAPVIMMSQNRQEDKDRDRARGDYMINLKSEIEIRSLHQKMDLIIEKQLHYLFEVQRAQLDAIERIEQKLKNMSQKD